MQSRLAQVVLDRFQGTRAASAHWSHPLAVAGAVKKELVMETLAMQRKEMVALAAAAAARTQTPISGQ